MELEVFYILYISQTKMCGVLDIDSSVFKKLDTRYLCLQYKKLFVQSQVSEKVHCVFLPSDHMFLSFPVEMNVNPSH